MFIKNNTHDQKYRVLYSHVSLGSLLSTRWLLHVLTKIKPYAKGKLLDVGCGIKPYEILFETESHLGVDWPSTYRSISVDVFADAQRLPFASDSFDTVLCTEVIEHLKCPWLAVNEMSRVLRPGGYLILSAPFVHNLHETPYDFFRFTYLGLQSLLEDSHLHIEVFWQRGGIVTVLIDLGTRLWASWLRSVFRRLPLTKSLQNRFLHILMGGIQRVSAEYLLRTSRYAEQPLIPEQPQTVSPITLGYVLVAKKLS